MWRVTEAEYQALIGKRKKPGKIPHTIIRADGYVFPSAGEHRRYGELKVLLATGAIRNLRIHPVYTFVVNDHKVGTYTADSSYEEFTGGEWVPVVEDVKSAWTKKDNHYRRQRKLMLAHHNITIREVTYGN